MGALLCALFPAVSHAQDQAACSLKRVTAVDMLSDFAPLAAIPVEVNGTKLQFFVDTAGILSSLSGDAVKKLNLSTRLGDEAEFQENGRRVNQTVQVASLKIGGLEGSNFEFTVDPDKFADSMDGRISPDILRGYDVDFDFANNKLNFFSQDHCEGKVVYWTTAYTSVPMTLDRIGHITIRVELDGQTLDAVVDTGSSQSTISEGIADRSFHVTSSTPGATQLPDTNPALYRYTFKSLTLNGVTVKNPVFVLMPDLAEQQMRNELGKLATDPHYDLTGDIPRLVIGMDILRQLHLYIAYKERKLYVTGASAH